MHKTKSQRTQKKEREECMLFLLSAKGDCI